MHLVWSQRHARAKWRMLLSRTCPAGKSLCKLDSRDLSSRWRFLVSSTQFCCHWHPRTSDALKTLRGTVINLTQDFAYLHVDWFTIIVSADPRRGRNPYRLSFFVHLTSTIYDIRWRLSCRRFSSNLVIVRRTRTIKKYYLWTVTQS